VAPPVGAGQHLLRLDDDSADLATRPARTLRIRHRSPGAPDRRGQAGGDRGKDIDVYFSTAVPGVGLGGGVGVAVEVRWPDVQSATIDWSQTLESDYEFGNAQAVS
jgi:hypothetical protein